MSEVQTTDGVDHPTSSTLSPVDVHIALATIEDAVNKLTLLEDLAPDLTTHRDELTLYVGAEISRIITKQRALEEELSRAIDERNALVQTEGTTRAMIREANQGITQISNAIKVATSELCRNLCENPSVTENLRKTQVHRSEVHKLLAGAYTELKMKNSYSELDRTVSEAHMALIEQERLEERERKARETVQELHAQIERIRQDNQRVLAERQEELKGLRADLAEQRRRIAETLSLYSRELTAANDEADRLRADELRKGQNLLNDISATIQQEEESHGLLFRALSGDGQRMAKVAGDWLVKSEEVVGQLELEIAQLEQLKKQCADTIFDLERRDEENKEEKKRWEEEEAFKQRMNEALYEARNLRLEVTRKYLQDTWRLALDPPDPEKKKKKSGKGKKGSKGKK